ncbi:A1S_2505 family phage non-structural protein [Microbacterium oleivorans]|uniref:A1S_2505 family phage non-structural protein n=1 Tax=Microbacterium oleivorans TaxID=273677 RepID=UPI001C4A2040|nr:hypothetical protein [Microbacterium oleivorans]
MSTAKIITELAGHEVFVFGSNAAGAHGAGAARAAYERFGAVWGEGHGHHGQSYAIDTMSGADALATGVSRFCEYAAAHPDLTFLVTEIGCGIAGYVPDEVAPLFVGAPVNVELPESFERIVGPGARAGGANRAGRRRDTPER